MYNNNQSYQSINKELYDKIRSIITNITHEQLNELDNIMTKNNISDNGLVMVWLDGVKFEGIKYPYNYLKKSLENAIDKGIFSHDDILNIQELFNQIREQTHEKDIKDMFLIELIENELYNKGLGIDELKELNTAILRHEKDNNEYFIHWLRKSRPIALYSINLPILEQEASKREQEYNEMLADLDNKEEITLEELDIIKESEQWTMAKD